MLHLTQFRVNVRHSQGKMQLSCRRSRRWFSGMNSSSFKDSTRDKSFMILSGFFVLFSLPSIFLLQRPNLFSSDCDNLDSNSLPTIREIDVMKHSDVDEGIWVIFDDKVYDITKFIVNHPGGIEKIKLAAGKRIEPFWSVYQQHYNSKLPMEILDSLLIGNLDPEDAAAYRELNKSDANDPYANDPKVSPLFSFHQTKPINAEPPRIILCDSWITPTNLWFVRNHHPVPLVDIERFRFEVSSELTDHFMKLDLQNFKTKYPKHEVVSTIQCGGNRRNEMNSISITAGSPWDVCAIATAKWGGVKLRDILRDIGIDEDNIDELGIKHLKVFTVDGLEVSIPIRKAISKYGDVLLAYEMNDITLTSEHGFPLRLIVPGHVGVRNAKWVTKIQLSAEEALGTWQRGMAYKGLPPSAKTLDGIDVERIPSLQEQPVQSAITSHINSSKFVAGDIATLKGYAYSGGGRGIVRVDVSIDGGENWKTANLREGSDQEIDRSWAWTLWDIDVEIPDDLVGKEIEVICKAMDASYNVQPESLKGIWNLRGINNNSWHRMKIMVDEETLANE